MKITDIRIRELTGTTQYANDLFQARHARDQYKAWKFIGADDGQAVL